MSDTTARATTLPTSREHSWRTLVALVVVITATGATAAALGFGLDAQAVPASPTVYPDWWPADPLFWLVWLVIYPCSAVAVWHLLRVRHQHDVRGAVTAFVLMNVASALFLPISSLVGELPSVMTLMDLNGVVAVYTLAWLFSRYSLRAAVWLTPYLLWMPTTTVLKALLWRHNA